MFARSMCLGDRPRRRDASQRAGWYTWGRPINNFPLSKMGGWRKPCLSASCGALFVSSSFLPPGTGPLALARVANARIIAESGHNVPLLDGGVSTHELGAGQFVLNPRISRK